MNDPVPAVTEAAATGEIAEIFADIRRVLGVEVVNLIWRHLAMIPGALPTAWGILRPPYADGTITAAASALRGELDLPRLPVLPAAALSAAGLLADDVRTIRNILAAYNKTNAMALVALSALSLRLDGATPIHEGASSHDVAPPPVALGPISLPPLPSAAELSAATAELVLTLNRFGTRREHPILASMYRHLAYWPSYLAITWAILAPLDADGSLDGLIAGAVAKAQASAVHVVRSPPPSDPAIDPALAATIRTAIEPFAGDAIAKMVVICAVLHSVTGNAQAPA
jgi:hypothetical protein